MSVKEFNWETKQMETRFEGAVLYEGERNYHDDSDFYAIVWDEEKQQIREIEYATTRCGGTDGNSANVDATPEVKAKANRYLSERFYPIALKLVEHDARVIHEGDRVRVIKGRKYPKGWLGVARWIGENRWGVSCRVDFGFNGNPETYQLFGASGGEHFISLKNLEKVDVDLVDPEAVRARVDAIDWRCNRWRITDSAIIGAAGHYPSF